MVTERQRRAKESSKSMSDGYIKDRFKDMIRGSKNYYDNMITNSIGSLISKADGGGVGVNKYMTLYVKHYDIPNELLDPIWKLNKSEQYFKLFNEAVIELLKECYPPELEEHWDIEYEKAECKIDVDDDKLLTRIDKLSNDYFLDKLVVFNGVIINKTNTYISVEERVFKCKNCGNIQDKKSKCASCEERFTVEFSMSDSKTISYEFMTIQERQDDINSMSALPQIIDIVVKGSLVNKFKPGDNVRVTGIVKPYVDNSSIESLNKKVSKDYVNLTKIPFIIDVHNIKYIGTSYDFILADPSKFITEYDMKAINGLRKKYNDVELLDVLKNSFCPNVYGLQAVKEALLIQSVGPGYIKGSRDWINIAIFGDAGVAKTEVSNAACKLNMHYAKAVGKGASGVGLTASVIKDDRGLPRLAVGAAVLADKGLCFIDEFSNIPDEYKEHLRECMDSGNLSINKQGINTTLKTRGPYLIISNPDSGKYQPYNALTDNIKISPPILSRFDIIFVVLDTVNKVQDQKVRVSIMARYNDVNTPEHLKEKNEKGDIINTISEDLLQKYIFYAKTRPLNEIKILDEARKRIDSFHIDLREPVKSSDITATPRQFEGILRISRAIARLLLKTEVTADIADLAIKLLNFAYESTGMKLGNSTGLNQTAIYSKPLNKVNKKLAFVLVMQNLTKDNKEYTDKESVILELRDKAEMDPSVAYELWNKFDVAGAISVSNNSKYKLNYDKIPAI